MQGDRLGYQLWFFLLQHEGDVGNKRGYTLTTEQNIVTRYGKLIDAFGYMPTFPAPVNHVAHCQGHIVHKVLPPSFITNVHVSMRYQRFSLLTGHVLSHKLTCFDSPMMS